jgi:hypothetical protein
MTQALENFLNTKIHAGILLLEREKGFAQIFFSLDDMSRDSTWISSDDLAAVTRGVSFEFVFRGSTEALANLPHTPQSERVMKRLQSVRQRETAAHGQSQAHSQSQSQSQSQSRRRLDFSDYSEKENLLGNMTPTLDSPLPHKFKNGTPIINLGTPILAPHLACPASPAPLIDFSSPAARIVPAPPATPAPTLSLPAATPGPLVDLSSPSPIGLVAPPPPPPPTSSIPRLPPPPSLPVPKLAAKKNAKKLRPLHWAAIPKNQIHNTVFGDLSPLSLESAVEKDMELLFSLSPTQTPAATPRTRALQKKTVSLLELRKSNNAGIVLAQFKISFDDMMAAVYGDQLSADQLIALRSLFPLSDTERRNLLEYAGPMEALPRAEQFYRQVLAIPRFEARIDAFLFRKQCAGYVEELAAQLKTVEEACEQVLASEKLKELLKLVLTYGQVLNRGTYLAAAGFRLSSLMKLAETKAKTSQLSFLDYVVRQVVDTGRTHLLRLFEELPAIFEAQRYDLGFSNVEVQDLRSRLNALEQELNIYRGEQRDQQFQAALQPLQQEASRLLADLEAGLARAKEKFDRVCVYYGESPADMNLSTLFGHLTAFATAYASSIATVKRG